VQTYVSRLRGALGVEGASLIVTRPPGYLADVEPGQVDAVRFIRLADSGRRSLAEGRIAEAAELLREATSLWRGDALAEFDAPFAERERVRLGELRLVAIEDRIAADLELGAGPELVGDLEDLIAAYPLRERLWEHLITALYRAGRQSDALTAYRRVRSVLVDDLGIEPGQRLRALERMVLAQDPALLARQPDALLPPLPGPLAALQPSLVGRDDDLGWLVAAYRQTNPAHVVCRVLDGPTGVGKTRLAAALAADVYGGGTAVEYVTGGGAVRRWPSWTHRPSVFICDDLDQAETAEIHRLAELLSVASGPLLVVLIVRGEALSAAQRAALDRIDTERRVLGGLPPDAVAQIVRGHVDEGDVPAALAAASDADGLPGAVHDAARGYAERRAAELVGGAAQDVVPSRRSLIARRKQLLHRVLDLQHLRRAHVATPSAGIGTPICPYKGLAAFDVTDADYFFGRERLVAH